MDSLLPVVTLTHKCCRCFQPEPSNKPHPRPRRPLLQCPRVPEAPWPSRHLPKGTPHRSPNTATASTSRGWVLLTLLLKGLPATLLLGQATVPLPTLPGSSTPPHRTQRSPPATTVALPRRDAHGLRGDARTWKGPGWYAVPRSQLGQASPQTAVRSKPTHLPTFSPDRTTLCPLSLSAYLPHCDHIQGQSVNHTTDIVSEPEMLLCGQKGEFRTQNGERRGC